LTYDLDLQYQARQGQDRPSRRKSRSKVKQFKQESAHRQTDRHTHGRYQTYYLTCYAVDNKEILSKAFILLRYATPVENN